MADHSGLFSSLHPVGQNSLLATDNFFFFLFLFLLFPDISNLKRVI